eukprot:GHRR01006113.1.p1 GENE.GHRR01006113.1~~GHRR01006113.1.p1  ORF type:complete len:242 (+),score=81.94 GHRR01006113.1:180-905(+)
MEQPSILLRTSSSKKNSHVVWDEDNLRENAEIQKDYTGIRIQEPKTPYHAPIADGDLLDEDMNPLELDGAPNAAGAGNGTAHAAMMNAFDYVMSNGGADYTAPGPSGRRWMSASSTGVSTDGPCHSFTSSGSEGHTGSWGSDAAEKKRRFAEMRKQHYNMKQALQQARHLKQSEDEEDEEADTAGYHRMTNGHKNGTRHIRSDVRGDGDADNYLQGQQQQKQLSNRALTGYSASNQPHTWA